MHLNALCKSEFVFCFFFSTTFTFKISGHDQGWFYLTRLFIKAFTRCLLTCGWFKKITELYRTIHYLWPLWQNIQHSFPLLPVFLLSVVPSSSSAALKLNVKKKSLCVSQEGTWRKGFMCLSSASYPMMCQILQTANGQKSASRRRWLCTIRSNANYCCFFFVVCLVFLLRNLYFLFSSADVRFCCRTLLAGQRAQTFHRQQMRCKQSRSPAASLPAET